MNRNETKASCRPGPLWRCQRGTAAVEFAILGPTFLVMLFGFVAFGTLIFTWSSMQSAAHYEALLVSTGQVTSLSSGAITSANNTATTACSSSLAHTAAEYYACSNLPGWGSYTVTTTEDCAVPSVTVNVSVNAGTAAIGDLLRIFAGRTLSARSVVMKEGKCPS